MRELERFVILQVVDVRWREHLDNMDYLREGVHLRSMAQKDPLVEYTAEGERMFTELGRVDPRRGRAASVPRRARAARSAQQELAQQQPPGGNGNLRYEHETSAGAEVIDAALGAGASTPRSPARRWRRRRCTRRPHEKVGRNDPCWCGSGKKFKKCHGA